MRRIAIPFMLMLALLVSAASYSLPTPAQAAPLGESKPDNRSAGKVTLKLKSTNSINCWTLPCPSRKEWYNGLPLPKRTDTMDQRRAVAMDLVTLTQTPLIGDARNKSNWDKARAKNKNAKLTDPSGRMGQLYSMAYDNPECMIQFSYDFAWELVRDGRIDGNAGKKLTKKLLTAKIGSKIVRQGMAAGVGLVYDGAKDIIKAGTANELYVKTFHRAVNACA